MNSTSSPLSTLLIWVIVVTALFVGREVLASLQQAVNADYVACSFNEAAALILAEAAAAARPPVSTDVHPVLASAAKGSA